MMTPNNIQISSETDLKSYLHDYCSVNDEISIIDEIKHFSNLKKKDLPYIFDIDHLAKLCGASGKQLTFFVKNKNKAYNSFSIPKKDGTLRSISSPCRELKEAQRWILNNILYKLNAGKYAHGFIPKRSIVTNAKEHINQKCILCFDLKDFFPSIKLQRVKSYFLSIGYNSLISNDLAEICTYRFRLAQGAPTSPMLSNLIAWKMDQDIAKFCRNRDLKYTRYADDIAISGNKNLPRYKKLIEKKIENAGFKINEKKTRVFSQNNAQIVTGIVVNEKLSIGREKKRNLKAIIHNIQNTGPVIANRDNDPKFKERIYGHIAFLMSIEPELGRKLMNILNNVDWTEYYESLASQSSTKNGEKIINWEASSYDLIPYKLLPSFKNIHEISFTDWTPELQEMLPSLKEKCTNHPNNELCSNCLYNKKKEFEKCIKHILGHYLQTTGGTHHGHELCDIGKKEEINNKIHFNCLLIKSKLSLPEKNSLFRQFFDCAHRQGIDIVTIVSTEEIDHNQKDRLITVMKENNSKKYCIIEDSEMKEILVDFKNNHSIMSNQNE